MTVCNSGEMEDMPKQLSKSLNTEKIIINIHINGINNVKGKHIC